MNILLTHLPSSPFPHSTGVGDHKPSDVVCRSATVMEDHPHSEALLLWWISCSTDTRTVRSWCVCVWCVCVWCVCVCVVCGVCVCVVHQCNGYSDWRNTISHSNNRACHSIWYVHEKNMFCCIHYKFVICYNTFNGCVIYFSFSSWRLCTYHWDSDIHFCSQSSVCEHQHIKWYSGRAARDIWCEAEHNWPVCQSDTRWRSDCYNQW